MSKPKLKFYVNLKKDESYIFLQFPLFKKFLGKEQFDLLLQKYYPDFNERKNLTLSFFSFWESNKSVILMKLEKKKKEITKKWEKIEDRFFNEIENKLGKWKRKKYFCHLSSTYISGGGYNYPTVIIFPFSKHISPLETIAHELLHLHLIEDIQRFGLIPKNFINFSEIAVTYASKQIKSINLKPRFLNEKIQKLYGEVENKIKKEKILCWKDFLTFLWENKI